VLTQYQLSPGFFLFIGTLQPRKNIDTILNAHASLPRSFQKRHPLVIVGRYGWGAEHLIPRIRQLEQEGTARWLDYVPKADVMALFQSACALTFVSLYEGFGLPLLEAFAANCPVIASNTTSIPEVAGDAAKLVNPLDEAELCSAMMQLVEDDALSATLKEKVKARAAMYTWNACAKATLIEYQKSLSV
jgi:alpha-1,3-rhamnosyl/mannosyltransferase